MSTISVEIVYALPDKAIRLDCKVPVGATVLDAIDQSGLLSQCPAINSAGMTTGIFGKKIPDPTKHFVEEGDRIEIYRPITADIKKRRKKSV